MTMMITIVMVLVAMAAATVVVTVLAQVTTAVLLRVTTVVLSLTVLLQATRLHHLHQHQLKVVSSQLKHRSHMAHLLATTVLATKHDWLVKAKKSPRKRAFLLSAE